ncbi:MAG: hypothetical protein HYY49_00625 [Ignavibacteriales bacterium]|nr:hypothetical protein [Ignavibacteriales bacterium]
MSGSQRDLQLKLKSHAAGILLMGAIFIVVVIAIEQRRDEAEDADPRIQAYIDARDIDFANPVDRMLFRETLDLFYPGQTKKNDTLLRSIDDFRQRGFRGPASRTANLPRGLTWTVTGKLMGMYVQFLVVYGVVLCILYFASQRIAIYRFVKMKQGRESYLAESVASLRKFFENVSTQTLKKELPTLASSFGRAILKGAILLICFSPAYVIAYSLKTTLDTSSLVFMIILGVVSNGVLMHTSNRFFTLLLTESRKGYVQTAIVKGLFSSYAWDTSNGIPKRSMWRTRGLLSSHVFQHILSNARFQFIPTLKEHASFLITGLVIIEMALNIQGHLCYELLQQILFRQSDVAGAIVFGIFLVVKGTEIGVDVWYDRERRKYGY